MCPASEIFGLFPLCVIPSPLGPWDRGRGQPAAYQALGRVMDAACCDKAKLPNFPDQALRTLVDVGDLNQKRCWETKSRWGIFMNIPERLMNTDVPDWANSFACYQLQTQYHSCVPPEARLVVTEQLKHLGGSSLAPLWAAEKLRRESDDLVDLPSKFLQIGHPTTSFVCSIMPNIHMTFFPIF